MKLKPNNIQKILSIEKNLTIKIERLDSLFSEIKSILSSYSDGKKLKGNELTGWLGEIYGKLLLGGIFVPDTKDYDIISGSKKVAIKARRGKSTVTSLIPKKSGKDCPTHLLFIQFTEIYKIKNIWLYPWKFLIKNKRLIEKRNKGMFRGYYVRASVPLDKKFLIEIKH